MARHQFEDIDQTSRLLDNTSQITALVVRSLGFILMIVGLWIGLKVINEAWSLYKQPQNIERFARAIESGSNLDKALTAKEPNNRSESAKAAESATDRVREVNNTLGFRLSYFVAWIIAILLLMLVGRLSIAAIKTGGELALYDLQIKRFAKYLADQAKGDISA
ncbi:MAG: hypothetical protein ACI915_000696 [Gammaproteobacteria bacterium]